MASKSSAMPMGFLPAWECAEHIFDHFFQLQKIPLHCLIPIKFSMDLKSSISARINLATSGKSMRFHLQAVGLFDVSQSCQH